MELTPTQQIERAIAEYQDAAQRAAEFRAEYAPMFERDLQLQEDVQLAKQAIADTLMQIGVDEGSHNGLRAALVKQDRGRYDANLLPQSMAVLEACDLSIDKKAVERLMEAGVITREQAAAAWRAKLAKPYVSLTAEKVEATA